MKLHIQEKLENISGEVFATDYAGDIANLLLNKPKAYRVLYDSKYGAYAIADAMNITHAQLARTLFDSGYIMPTPEELQVMRKNVHATSSASDAQIYYHNGFYGDNSFCSFMFMPSDYRYSAYDDLSIYTNETRIKSGIIYCYNKRDLTAKGILKDLFTVLKQRDAFPKSLEKLFRSCKDISEFTIIAQENGYTAGEAADFIDNNLYDE